MNDGYFFSKLGQDVLAKQIMTLAGFDIGNDTSVVAVVKDRSTIDVLLNDESKYETPSVVSFAQRNRHFGHQALSFLFKNPAATISQIKRIIGRRYGWPGMKELLDELPFSIRRDEHDGILIRVDDTGEEPREYTPVQILAMLLSNLRKMVEENAGGVPISRLVVGVPSYFTDCERIAYLDAVEISGVDRCNVRLMHEGTAIALGYGFYKPEFSGIVVFVDVGHCHTQVTVARFSLQKMQVLCHQSNRSLGGRDFDRVLFAYFCRIFRNKYSDISLAGKNIHRMNARLMSQCEKAKKVLTSNTEAWINIESVVDDLHFSQVISREEFDLLSAHLVQNITDACRKALIECGITTDQVQSVELAGSGSRIPAISNDMSRFFNKNMSRTLNSSECIARGCALQASIMANSIKNYKVWK